MELAGYQIKHGLSVGGLAALIGVTEHALYRYMHQERIPQTAVMKRIIAATGGEVTPNDFYLTLLLAAVHKRLAAA